MYVHQSEFPCFVLLFRVSWYAQSQAQWAQAQRRRRRVSAASRTLAGSRVQTPCSGTHTCNRITNGDICVVCVFIHMNFLSTIAIAKSRVSWWYYAQERSFGGQRNCGRVSCQSSPSLDLGHGSRDYLILCPSS